MTTFKTTTTATTTVTTAATNRKKPKAASSSNNHQQHRPAEEWFIDYKNISKFCSHYATFCTIIHSTKIRFSLHSTLKNIRDLEKSRSKICEDLDCKGNVNGKLRYKRARFSCTMTKNDVKRIPINGIFFVSRKMNLAHCHVR